MKNLKKVVKSSIEAILNVDNKSVNVVNFLPNAPGIGLLHTIMEELVDKKTLRVYLDMFREEDFNTLDIDEFDVVVYENIHKSTSVVSERIFELIYNHHNDNKPAIIIGDMNNAPMIIKNRIMMVDVKLS